MRVRRGWLAIVLALGMLVAACGQGGTETTDTEAPTDTEATTTTAATDDTEPMEDTTTTGGTAAPGDDVEFDVGVTEDTITVGLLADLTGIFSPLVQDIVEAQRVFWDIVNENGGIAGRTIELEVLDTNYNPDQHRTQYEAMRDQVAMISQSTGSPQTASIIDLMIEDEMVAIPLSWYSGWADPSIDESTALEQQTNYCIEGMNVVEWMSEMFEEENGEPPSWAVISFPGEYGQDSAFGAKHAVNELGLELAFDGEGLVTPDEDPETEVITGIVESGADIVFATTNPGNLATIMGGAAQAGYQGLWTGAVPSYDFRLLDTPVGPILDSSYFQSAYNLTWGTAAPGMDELREAMLSARPDLRPSDAFVLGWLEGKTTEAVLRIAAENGDMTRAGIKEAALSLEGLSFDGVAPDQSYSPPDDPNSFITREIAMLKPNLDLYNEAGGANQTIGSAPDGGTTGSELVEEFFVGDVAAAYEFTGACFTTG